MNMCEQDRVCVCASVCTRGECVPATLQSLGGDDVRGCGRSSCQVPQLLPSSH